MAYRLVLNLFPTRVGLWVVCGDVDVDPVAVPCTRTLVAESIRFVVGALHQKQSWLLCYSIVVEYLLPLDRGLLSIYPLLGPSSY